jgi:hypothetical protein
MSKIEVDAIDKQSGSTLTLGGSGTAVTLACGATQTGFGRTGTVDWQTGSIKTATFTAANGEGYFANTSGGAFTMNLPAGTAGNIVSVVDYTNTFQTNNLTIAPNGSQKIGGIAASNVLSTEGQSVTFVYVDDTEGWKNVQDSTSNVTGNEFIIATGGTITTCGNDKIHTFTGPGTFTVSQVHPCAANNLVSYAVIAGGGGGGSGTPGSSWGGAGGGAGGYRETKSPATPYTASPLDGYSTPGNRITVTASAFPITVGSGGTSGPVSATAAGKGSNSVFSTITSTGGGGGGSGRWTPSVPYPNAATAPQPGGSGGGATVNYQTQQSGGSGNTPPVSPPQGNNGGTSGNGSANFGGGGGGGAGAVGTNSPSSPGGPGGTGGNGVTSSINGTPTARAGGGGGGGFSGCGSTEGGSGGAGTSPGVAGQVGSNGTDNTGSGAGGGTGACGGSAGGVGGSGVVIIRYKFK